MGNHFRIVIEHYKTEHPEEVTVMGTINMTETADSNPRYADFACWQSKWQRPKHPQKRGNVRFKQSRNSWELIYEAVRMFCMPVTQDEVDNAAIRSQEASDHESRPKGEQNPTE
jgi:hypothetical protein